MTSRDAYLRRTYGITEAEYDLLVERQAGRCPVCWKVPKTALVVDHDHKTGILRGLLCRMCNYQVIGRRRDPDIFSQAAEYLRNPPAVTWLGERTVPAKPKRRKRRRNNPSE